MISLPPLFNSNLDVTFNTTESTKLLPSYDLFHKIRQLTLNSILWGDLLKIANREILDGSTPSEELDTSCIVNFCLLNMIFLGEEKAKEIMNPLTVHFTFNLPLTIVENENLKTVDLLFHHFLTGNAIIHQNKKYKKSSYKSFSNDFVASFNSREFTTPFNIFKEKIGKLYSGELDPFLFAHCKNVVDNLENEIEGNRDNVTENCSFIYHVLITTPDYTTALNGSQEQISKSPINYYHSFILEHYYSKSANTDFIRLHNAWKDEFSLSSFYDNMKYCREDENCLSKDQRKLFFSNFRDMLSCRESTHFEELESAQSFCFKVKKQSMPVAAIFRKDEGIFTGLSLRYMTSIIDPKDCIVNINNIKERWGL
jgi:hypothetical protein